MCALPEDRLLCDYIKFSSPADFTSDVSSVPGKEPTQGREVGRRAPTKPRICPQPEGSAPPTTDMAQRDLVYLNTTGEGPQNLCSVFLMLSVNVDSSKYHVLWSEAEGPAVGSGGNKESVTWRQGLGSAFLLSGALHPQLAFFLLPFFLTTLTRGSTHCIDGC